MQQFIISSLLILRKRISFWIRKKCYIRFCQQKSNITLLKHVAVNYTRQSNPHFMKVKAAS